MSSGDVFRNLVRPVYRAISKLLRKEKLIQKMQRRFPNHPHRVKKVVNGVLWLIAYLVFFALLILAILLYVFIRYGLFS